MGTLAKSTNHIPKQKTKARHSGFPMNLREKHHLFEIKRLKRSGADRPGRRSTSRGLPLGQLNAHLSGINPMGLNGAMQR